MPQRILCPKAAVLVCLILLVVGIIFFPAMADSPGNTYYDTAEPLPPNGHVNGTVDALTDTADYYKFDLLGGEVLTAQFTNNASSVGTLIAFVADRDQNRYDVGEIDPGQNRSFRLVIGDNMGGTYYAIAINSDHLNVIYEINVTWVLQDDAGLGNDGRDDYKNAGTILPGPVYTAQIGVLDAQDTFAFDLEDGAKVNITLNVGESSILDLAVHDWTTAEYLAGKTTVGPNENGTFSLMLNSTRGGKHYFLATKHFPDTNINYSFSFKVEAQNDAGMDVDAPEEYISALEIEHNRPFSGDIGSLDQNDCYILDQVMTSGIDLKVGHDTKYISMDLYLFGPNGYGFPMIEVPYTEGFHRNIWLDGSDAPVEGLCLELPPNIYQVVHYSISIAPLTSADGGTGSDAWALGDMAVDLPIANQTFTGAVGTDWTDHPGDRCDLYNINVPSNYNLTIKTQTMDIAIGLVFKVLLDSYSGQTLYTSEVQNKQYGEYTTRTGPATTKYVLSFTPLTARVNYTVMVKMAPAVDLTPPTISVNTSIDPDQPIPYVTIEGTAHDDVGLSRVEWSMNGGPWGECVNVSGNWTSWQCKVKIVKGMNTLTLRAVDTSGNKGTSVHSMNLTPPVLTLTVTEPADGSTVNTGNIVLVR